jgi:hypothetical protein
MSEGSLKKCSKCGEEKSLVEFPKNKHASDGCYSYCKVCVKKIDKIRSKKYRIKNFEKNKLKNKRFYLNYPNYNKEYYIEHKEKIKQTVKSYVENNKEHVCHYQKEYRRTHPQIINLERNRHNDNIKYSTSIQFKLTKISRNRVNAAIKNNQRGGHTLELLGCSIDFLKEHLELQFQPDMTWDNWGTGKNGKGMQEWHIDHFYPCSSFDLSKESEQYICFNWGNLRPLWAKENLEKSDDVI